MNGQGTNADFAVEVRERYGEVVRDQWPVSVDPLPDELLSSWVHRLAFANGIAPRSFATIVGLGDGMWSPRLDLRLPRHVAGLLCDQTGVPDETIAAMTMTGCPLTPLLLPLRENAHRRRSTWLQYCSLCLAADEAPYFRRQWRLASRVSCFAHGCGLRDRCPACGSGIGAFQQHELIPQHFCARCSFDLRASKKVSVKAAVRRLESAIMDMCRVERAKGSPGISDLISRLLRVPVAADVIWAKSLTSLSTSARIRCLERLAPDPLDWLIVDAGAAVAHRRWMILATGGHKELIARFADFLEKYRMSPRPKRSPPAGADQHALFAAYSRVMDPGGARALARSRRGQTPAPH